MFRYDSPFFDFLGKIVDMIILGALWFVMCLPIITIGASTTAAYYVTFNQLNGKDGYVITSFFKSFKQNFKQATILFSIIAVIGIISAGNIYVLNNYISLEDTLSNVLKGVQVFVLLELWLLFFYSFALLSKISFTFKGLILTSLQMANKHLLVSILSVAIVIGLYYAVAYFPILFLFGGAIYFLIAGFIMKFVIKKYRHDIFDLEIADDVYKLNDEATNSEN